MKLTNLIENIREADQTIDGDMALAVVINMESGVTAFVEGETTVDGGEYAKAKMSLAMAICADLVQCGIPAHAVVEFIHDAVNSVKCSCPHCRGEEPQIEETIN